MTQMNSYLTFNGNCREAMHFYKDCLGGELMLQTVGESPMADKMPEPMKDCIMHATLTKDTWMLMGTDMVCDEGLIKGNTVGMVLNCSSEDEINNYYAKLSAGGEATHPLQDTFWGALFGDLVDKYGNHWLLNYEKKKVSRKGAK